MLVFILLCLLGVLGAIRWPDRRRPKREVAASLFTPDGGYFD